MVGLGLLTSPKWLSSDHHVLGYILGSEIGGVPAPLSSACRTATQRPSFTKNPD